MDNDNKNWHNAAGKFAKGNPGKKPGTAKSVLREKIRTFLDDNFDNLPEWFDQLKAKDRIDAYLSLLPYAVSRLQSVSMTDSNGDDIEKKAIVDYTLLDQKTLKKILSVTTIQDERLPK
jgi:hypothetical protein